MAKELRIIATITIPVPPKIAADHFAEMDWGWPIRDKLREMEAALQNLAEDVSWKLSARSVTLKRDGAADDRDDEADAGGEAGAQGEAG